MLKFFFILLFFVYSQSFGQYSQNGWSDYISFYQQFGSPLVGGNCKMYPSCSKFAMMQFESKNFISAFSLSADRLMRCSHDVSNYSLTFEGSNYKQIDFLTTQENKTEKTQWNEVNFAFQDSVQNKSEEFINFLLNKELYTEALIEINKVLFLFPKDKIDISIFVNYFRCLRSLGKNERVNLEFQTIIPTEFKENSLLLIELSRSWIALGNYQQAEKILLQIISNPLIKINLKDEAKILVSICYANQFKWKETNLVLNQINQNSLFASNASHNLKFAREAMRFRPKKRWIATVMSIIPGAGYLYSKHPSTAFSSLVANGLLYYAAQTSFSSGNTGIGILTSIIGFGFYFGNIQGSSKSVDRYNLINQENYAQKFNLQFSF